MKEYTLTVNPKPYDRQYWTFLAKSRKDAIDITELLVSNIYGYPCLYWVLPTDETIVRKDGVISF